MPLRSVTVFGGTGFLGRRVAARLADEGVLVRVATRHPERRLAADEPPGRRAAVGADVRDSDSVARAVDGADGVVNCVSLYVETRGTRFRDIHVAGATNVAAAARTRGLPLVHLSGIGADAESPSAYVRARGLGEAAVRAAHPDATILRPSVMFGPDDAFLNTLDRIAALTPVIPLFGAGATRLQPVHVADVAAAVVTALQAPAARGRVFELGGPQVVSYRQLLEQVLRWKRRRRLLLPLPFAAWDVLAAAGRWLPAAPVTEGQVALMKRDNVVSPGSPGFAELGLAPQPLATVLGSPA
jgi:NADH dehydrogenase